MSDLHLFCCHGWVRTTEPHWRRSDRGDRMVEIQVIEPPDSVIHHDRLWESEVVRVDPVVVLGTIGLPEAWLLGSKIPTHARFFRTPSEAYDFAREHPPDQRNFVLHLNNARRDRRAADATVPAPFPTPEWIARSPYLLLDAYLDRWGQTRPRWFSSEAEVDAELHLLAGMTSGCMLRCALRMEEEAPVVEVVAAWLYATGPTDRMRWSLLPWPEKFPPPHVPARAVASG